MVATLRILLRQVGGLERTTTNHSSKKFDRMRPVRCRASSALSLVAAVAFLFGVAEVQAAEFRHLDGMHRVGKMEARVTEPAQLFRRQGSDVEACGSSMLLCPSSVGGGCCPEGYECASESCYATTRGPATCGDRVGWYACSAVYGGEFLGT